MPERTTVRSLNEMLARLIAGNVEFVLVGGYAAVTHGVTLVTQDVDICCRFSSQNLRTLQRVVSEFHPRHRMTPQKLPLELNEEMCSTLKNLYLETDLCVLDCLSEVKGVGSFEEVLKVSEELETPVGTFKVLGVDALIQAKKAMDRPHDRLTITQLQAIKERRGL